MSNPSSQQSTTPLSIDPEIQGLIREQQDGMALNPVARSTGAQEERTMTPPTAGSIDAQQHDTMLKPAPATEETDETMTPETKKELKDMAIHMDEGLRTVSMLPWMRAPGEVRASREQEILDGLIPLLTGMLPSCMLVVERIRGGERDLQALVDFAVERSNYKTFAIDFVKVRMGLCPSTVIIPAVIPINTYSNTWLNRPPMSSPYWAGKTREPD
jgi:hypothetical protein